MKRFVVISLALMLCALLSAQNENDTLLVEKRDTATYAKLFEYLSGQIIQSDSLELSMLKQIEKNKERTFIGYRLRIFFDNKQNARAISEQIAISFSELYPDIKVYRLYNNPYWRVTVGDFRSKSDALKFLNIIKEIYPSVFLVKESFSTI